MWSRRDACYWSGAGFPARPTRAQEAGTSHQELLDERRLDTLRAKGAEILKNFQYVGRFEPRKGIETLVRAVAKSSLRGQANLQLIIGGGSRPGQSDGNERDRIEGIVNQLGLSDMTTFPGQLGNCELPTLP